MTAASYSVNLDSLEERLKMKGLEMNVVDLFQIVGAERSVIYEDRIGGIHPERLQELQRRLGTKLPLQLHAFLEQAGPGEFRFGRVFSPVAASGALSELEDELQAFRESEQFRKLSARLKAQSSPPIDLLPFCRSKSGWLFFFDLAGDSEPDTLWSWDTLSPDDVPTCVNTAFSEWLKSKYEAEIATYWQLMGTIQWAIDATRGLSFSYKGEVYIGNPIGFLANKKTGASYLRLLQTSGFTTPDHPLPCTKSFHPAEISELVVQDEVFTFEGAELEELGRLRAETESPAH